MPVELSTTAQYMLVFWSYCFLGWVWESLLVSCERRRWVNRGFLFGPWIPIYGFGAVIILCSTEPFRTSALLVFFSGMTSSTTLEYVTGWAMEKIFQVRYWDYSERRFNINGYVCLRASLTWGVFSVLLVDAVEPPLVRLISSIPIPVSDMLNLALTALFAADVVKSVQAASGLKELLQNISSNNERLAAAESRLNSAAAELGANMAGLKEKLASVEAAFAARREAARERGEERREKGLQLLLKLIERERRAKYDRIHMMESKASAALEMIERAAASAHTDEEKGRLARHAAALKELREAMRSAETELASYRDRDYRRALSLLRRNPTAASSRHSAAFDKLRRIDEDAARR